MMYALSTALVLAYVFQSANGAIESGPIRNESSTEPTFYNNERDLMIDVLKDYRKEFRPVKDSRRAINIQLFPQLEKIIKLDEKEGVLKVGIYTHMMWVDEYLTWDISQTYGIWSVVIPSELLYIPHLRLNEQRMVGDSLDSLITGSIATVNTAGGVSISPVIEIEANCQIFLQAFPFDKQFCALTFLTEISSTVVGLTAGDANNYPSNNAIFQPGNEWTNVETNVTQLTLDIAVQGYTYSMNMVILVIGMERNPTFYLIYILIPSMLMAFVSVLVFLLPPESGERIGLCITVLLSYTVFLLMVSEFTPRGGNDTAFIALYITGIEILSGLNLFFTVIVLRIHTHEADDPMPSYLKRVCCGRKGNNNHKNPWHQLAKDFDTALLAITLLTVLILTGLLIGYYVYAANTKRTLEDFKALQSETIAELFKSG